MVTTRSSRIAAGDLLPGRKLLTVDGGPVAVPDPDRLVHLQFRRFAGCPVCNLHLRSVAQRHDEILAAGIREVVLFHSPAEDLRTYVADLPFAAVADPDKLLYIEFGVETSPRALLDPRAWPTLLRAVAASLPAALRKQKVAPADPPGGRLGLPADFLIGCDGRILATHHGSHIGDQWSVDELLALAGKG